MEVQRIYKNESNPLKEVYIEDARPGELYVTSTGTRIRFISEGVYEIDKTSPLKEGELIETLTTPTGIKMFWNIIRK